MSHRIEFSPEALGDLIDICDYANSREPKVDGRCGVALQFQIDAIASDDGPVEREPRLRTTPVDEVANGVVVRALRAFGREAVEDCGSGLL